MAENGLRLSELCTEADCHCMFEQVKEKLGYSDLTIHQQQAILKFVSGCDVLVVLPTGSGKSVCFAVLPWPIPRKAYTAVLQPLLHYKDCIMCLLINIM